jgi:hypothetical protein
LLPRQIMTVNGRKALMPEVGHARHCVGTA